MVKTFNNKTEYIKFQGTDKNASSHVHFNLEKQAKDGTNVFDRDIDTLEMTEMDQTEKEMIDTEREEFLR